MKIDRFFVVKELGKSIFSLIKKGRGGRLDQTSWSAIEREGGVSR